MPPEDAAALAAPIATRPPAGGPIMPAGIVPAVTKAQATTADGLVMVKPRASYFCSATQRYRGVGGDAYPVETGRAAELFARGLVEYADAAEEARAVEAQVKAGIEAARTARRR